MAQDGLLATTASEGAGSEGVLAPAAAGRFMGFFFAATFFWGFPAPLGVAFGFASGLAQGAGASLLPEPLSFGTPGLSDMSESLIGDRTIVIGGLTPLSTL